MPSSVPPSFLSSTTPAPSCAAGFAPLRSPFSDQIKEGSLRGDRANRSRKPRARAPLTTAPSSNRRGHASCFGRPAGVRHSPPRPHPRNGLAGPRCPVRAPLPDLALEPRGLGPPPSPPPSGPLHKVLCTSPAGTWGGLTTEACKGPLLRNHSRDAPPSRKDGRQAGRFGIPTGLGSSALARAATQPSSRVPVSSPPQPLGRPPGLPLAACLSCRAQPLT